MQICQLSWTRYFSVNNCGIVPLEAVKVFATLAQGWAVEEAAVAIDIRVLIANQPRTASSKSWKGGEYEVIISKDKMKGAHYLPKNAK